MSTFTIYHNPWCGKSRATLALLQERGIEPQVIEYLKDPPSAQALSRIARLLGVSPEQLVRKGEEIYKTKYAGKALNDEQWLDVLAANPILIERPIVVSGNAAVIGRPPENVLTLIER